MTGVLIFILILVVLVLFHEFGHFLFAKLAGIRVDEFSIGFPPRILKKKMGETTYSIGVLLLGGYVKIFGETPDDVSGDEAVRSRSFIAKPKWVQALVIFAGIFFNVILAWLLLSVGYFIGIPLALDDVPKGATVTNQQLVIYEALPGSPAALAGLASGDTIDKVSAGDDALTTSTTQEFSDFINAHAKGVDLAYHHGAEAETAHIVPVTGFIEGRTAIGVSLVSAGNIVIRSPLAFWEGAKLTLAFTEETWDGLLQFFGSIFHGTADFSQVRGPVGIVQVVSDESALGFVHVLLITALISINLAIINVLPLPALDGGRLFFLLIEAIVRRPFSQSRFAVGANVVGLALLILLLVIVSYHDIARIIAG